MEIPRLHREINEAEDKLDKMKRSRNWYRQRYQTLMAYFVENDIPPPLHRESPPDDGEVSMIVSPPEGTIPLTKLEQVKHAVLSDLNLNCDRAPSRHRYLPETLSFAFAAHVFSATCYRFIREILDLPSEQTLRELTRESVTTIKVSLTDVDLAGSLVAPYLDDYSSLLGTAPLRCRLCIDAFSIDPTARTTYDPHKPNACKDCFLFQLTPLDRRFRVLPIHIHPASNGVASQAFRVYADKVIEKVSQADTRIIINFISVDGDEGYNDYFEATFNLITDFLKRAEFGNLFCDFILSQRRFWISDWLHLMKNARTKLFDARIVINPQNRSAAATMDGIAKYFDLSPTFTDNSPLGKMRDCYPLDLFTLRRAHILFERGNNINEFLYIFIMALWSEAIENRLFSWEHRIAILETLMNYFYVQYEYIMKKKYSGVAQKRTSSNSYVTFVSKKKLQRFLCTLAGQYTGILLEDPNLGLDRIGSHTEENFIGNIRSICHCDNRIDNVEHQVARFELARSQLCGIGVERKIAKRVNLGGISFRRGEGVEMELQGTPASFAAELLNLSHMQECFIGGRQPDSYPACGFIDQIWHLMKQSPLDARFSRVQMSTQGSSIVSRYHVFRSTSEQEETIERPIHRPGPWSAEERHKLREVILAGNREMNQIRYLFPERSIDAIRRQLHRIEQELSCRSWTQDENNTIIQFIRKGYGYMLSRTLICRSVKAITDQMFYLRSIGAL
jgi:hypothetical protein